jgi:hypothetical protein
MWRARAGGWEGRTCTKPAPAMFVHSPYPATDLIQEGGTDPRVKITGLSDAVQPRQQNENEDKACKQSLLKRVHEDITKLEDY